MYSFLWAVLHIGVALLLLKHDTNSGWDLTVSDLLVGLNLIIGCVCLINGVAEVFFGN